jgi:thiol-disulfide isomerase/thioredoxin
MIYDNIYNIENGVIELTLSDFIYIDKKLYINNNYFANKEGLIIFYAPWCVHCKKIAPMIMNIAIDKKNLFNFGAVNSENIDEHNDILCNRASIVKYPTIKYIKKDGSLENFKFEYTEDNLIYFVNTYI